VAERLQKINPEVRIDISAGGAGKGMTDALTGTADLGMVSRAIMPAEVEKGAWALAVTKDAVLPTISSQNPVLSDLKTTGVTCAQFKQIFIEANVTTWGEIVHSANVSKLNLYTRSDACGAAQTWASYLGGVQEDLKGIGVFGDPGLADAVKKDPLGIGFNNTIYIYNLTTDQKYEGLEIVPIDVNENGKIDPDEDFYGTMKSVMAAIASGQYPSPPARELYLVGKGKPQSEVVIAFLKWILNDGQKYVTEAGYVPLKPETIQTEMHKLD
jgi:phosphate transport system substrate-binding protein